MDKEWFDNALNDKSNKNIYFGVDEILTNEFIGIVQLNNIDYVSGTALLGFVIGDTKFRGKGYGFEFSCLIVSYAFLTLNLRKIITYNLASNDSTLSMQKKLGFLQEGELKEHIYHDGKFYDVIILSLLRNKYLEIND
jgi:RimJ/RimL family protein N-acetyltransferase